MERWRFLYFKFSDKRECPSTFKRPFSILTIFSLCFFLLFSLSPFFFPSFADSFSILLLIQWWCGWRGEHRHGADDRLKRDREQFESGVWRSWTSFRYRIRIISNWMLKDSKCSTRLFPPFRHEYFICSKSDWCAFLWNREEGKSSKKKTKKFYFIVLMIWLPLVGTLFGACCFLFTWACRSISFCGGCERKYLF